MAKKVRIHLDDDLYEVLKGESERRGISLSALVRERLLAVEKETRVAEIYESMPRMLDDLRRETRAFKEEMFSLFTEVKTEQRNFQAEVIGELKRFDRRLEKLEKALAVTAYYAAFAGILQSKKFFNVMNLKPEEWDKLKSLSRTIKEEADEKVRLILGESIFEKLQG